MRPQNAAAAMDALGAGCSVSGRGAAPPAPAPLCRPVPRGLACSSSSRDRRTSSLLTAAGPPPAAWVEAAAGRVPGGQQQGGRGAGRAAAGLVGSAERLDPEAVAASKPTSAETARTVVAIVTHGTLCTLGSDGIPLGTYASYILDDQGQPIVRLRADAVHTANLRRQPQCSLFVQPEDTPARLLARVTLIGRVHPLHSRAFMSQCRPGNLILP